MNNYKNENVLSLDLGTNSIGWAIVNPCLQKIYHTGINIFPEGVNREKGKEKSRTQERREARGQRRNFFRKKYMQIRLQRKLISYGLFPIITNLISYQEQKKKILESIVEYYKPALTIQDDFKWDIDYLMKKFKFSLNSENTNFQVSVFRILQDYGFMKIDESNTTWTIIQKLISFFSLDPYELRHDAVKDNPRSLSKLEFGRIIYHLSQLRGFSSNRTDADLLEKKEKTKKKNEEDETEETDSIEKSKEKKSKDERVNELWKLLVEKYNCKTYGQFFYKIKNGEIEGKEKIRGERDTCREKYREEFDLICKSQKENGTEELKNVLSDNSFIKEIGENIIYYQRPLKSQKGLIGKCKLESHRVLVTDNLTSKQRLENRGKPRCPVSALPYERFVMLQEINNMFLITEDGEKLDLDEETSKKIYSLYLQKESFGVVDIANKIELKAGWFIKGKLDNSFHPKENAYKILKETLGESWKKLKEEKKNKLWLDLYFCKTKDNQTEQDAIISVLNNRKFTIEISDQQASQLAKVFPCKGDIKLYGCNTHILLKKILGVDTLDETTKEKLKIEKQIDVEQAWQILFQYRTTAWQGKDENVKKNDWLMNYGKSKWKLDDNIADTLPKISKKIKTGYGNLSRKAINNILVYLGKGMIYSHAVFFANLPDVFKDKLNEVNKDWNTFESENKIEDKLKRLLYTEYPPYQRMSSVIFQCWLHAEEYGTEGLEKKMKDEIKNQYRNIDIKPDERESIEEEVGIIKTFKDERKTISLKNIKTKSKSEFIKDFLKNKFSLSDKALDNLYHPSQIEKYPQSCTTTDKGKELMKKFNIRHLDKETALTHRIPLLLESPIIPGLKNPVVIQTLHEVKHLVNEMINTAENDSTYKIDRIRIEINRELNDKNKRIAYRNWQRDNEAEREKAKKKLEDCGINSISEDDILKYRLLTEMIDMGIITCPYCNADLVEKITCMNISKIFGANPDYNIDHIIPEEISCDSTMENLILCCKKCNQEIKKKKMPSELDNYESQIKERVKGYRGRAYGLKKQIEDKTKAIRTVNDDKDKQDKLKQERAKLRFNYDYYNTKYRNLTCTEEVLEKRNFKERQLPDTGFITKYALAYLKTAFPIVEAVKGKATANFRKEWGLQPDDEKKDRSQHLHHAIDACVIGCLNKRIYDSYASFLQNEDSDYYRKRFIKPWSSFVEDIKESISKVLVYYKTNNRNPVVEWNYTLLKDKKSFKRVAVRGEMHNANFFGKVGEKDFTQKDYINGLTLAKISKIKDERLKNQIIETIIKETNTNVFVKNENNYEYVKSVLSGKDKEKKELEKKINKEVLNNGYEDSITKTTVKKVKILEHKKNIRPLYGLNKWVEPGNNFGAIVFKENGELKHKIIYFFDVIREKNVKDFIDELTANGEIFLQQTEIYCLGLDNSEFDKAIKERDYSKLHQHLYDLKKISSQTNDSSKPFYEFKFHLDAQMGKSTEETQYNLPKLIQIQNFGDRKTGWLKWNPKKVIVDRLGNIKPAIS